MGQWTDVPQRIEDGTSAELRELHEMGFRLNDEFLLGIVVQCCWDLRRTDPIGWRASVDKTWDDFKRIRDGMGLR